MLKYICERWNRECQENGPLWLFKKYSFGQLAWGGLLAFWGTVAGARVRLLNVLEKSDFFVRIFRKRLAVKFNKMYFMLRKNTFDQTFFMGKNLMKFPTDLWTYQEIFFECQPDVIVETGIFLGGSTYYFSKLCQMMGKGRIIGIDTVLDHVDDDVRKLSNVTLIEGSSRDQSIYERVKAMIKPGESVMVILDSDHTPEHVYKEMKLFAQLVTPGQYLVVEDGIVDQAYPLFWRRRGPLKAVRQFVNESSDFAIDHYRTRFMLTHTPSGYLRRQGPTPMRFEKEEDCYRPYRLWLTGLAQDASWMPRVKPRKNQ